MKLLDYEMLCALESHNIQQALAIIGDALQVQMPPITNFHIYEDDSVQAVCVFANGNKYAWVENSGFICKRDSNLGLANWAVFYLNKKL
jgi:hypothetical protein